MNKTGSAFLHERNPDLHSSSEVEDVVAYLKRGGDSIPNQPVDKIAAYIGFLADTEYVNDGIITGEQASKDRQIDAKTIKPHEIPASYFETQQRIAREQGRDVQLIDTVTRQEAARVIGSDQRHSLATWVNYLSNKNSMYPDWFKLYVFDAVTKIGKYDKQKEEFQKRSKSTTAPFVELSRGALSQVYTWIKETKIDGKEPSSEFTDHKREQAFQKALRSGNFSKLYGLAIHKTQEGTITPEQRAQLNGSWKKYKQHSNPRKLHGDLQGFGLDWCTATGYQTASAHIEYGDFYVYYTTDTTGVDRIPRFAVRMEDGEVAEVRGINDDQELEPELSDVVVKKLKTLPGGESYVRRAEDMKRLTAMYKKVVSDPEVGLSDEDIKLLYELDRPVSGFGYEPDPRFEELKKIRAGMDESVIERLLPEIMKLQFQTAFNIYDEVTQILITNMQKRAISDQAEVQSVEQAEKLFAEVSSNWETNGVYGYIARRIANGKGRYNLLITPNFDVNPGQVMYLAKRYCDGKNFPTSIYKRKSLEEAYSGVELSGNNGSAPIRFTLMPTEADRAISYRHVDQQKLLLERRQTQHPELKFRVPSVLDAITHWFMLRAQSDALSEEKIYEMALIRHFDLDPINIDGDEYTIMTSLSYEDEAAIHLSQLRHMECATVALG